MSRYTEQLRGILEGIKRYYYPDDMVDSYNNVIALASPKLFDFSFPIFDEEYRQTLITKICKHFYQREIGLETVGQFKLRLDEKLNLIMPYYNMLYKQGIDELNLFRNTDMHIEHSLEKTGDIVNEGNATSSGESKSVNKFSDTPQGTLAGVESATYLTDVTINNANDSTETEQTNTQTINTTDSYIEHRFGYEGLNPVEQLLRLKETFFNIDFMILDKLEDLFIQIW